MDKDNLKIIANIALINAFGYTPRISREIINILGSAKPLLKMTESELKDLFGPYSSLSEKLNPGIFEAAEKEYESLKKQSCQFLTIEDEFYPPLLFECHDAPNLLYIRSETPVEEFFGKGPAISIIGTRDISSYGKDWCERIIRAFANAKVKPTIVSGLAIGVDICAHLEALNCNLPTIGVSPVGMDDIYPHRHQGIAARMTRSPKSGIITDFPPKTAALTQNFFRRNRIIAGLSEATILIESKYKGGGMMTSRLAASYGRGVYALPGRVDDIRSGGCNQLIWEKLADPIYSVETLVQSLGLGQAASRRRKDIAAVVREHYTCLKQNPDADNIIKVFEMILGNRAVSCDELCERTSFSYSQIMRIVGRLESDGFICTDLLRRCTVVI